jgi:predicted alpha-1,2-mannosidase
MPLRAPRFFRFAALAVPLAISPFAARGQVKTPVEAANPLVGTAPLDRRDVIGNAPPPGESLYSGFVSPGAMLPFSVVETSPVNVNLTLTNLGGVPWYYYYPQTKMWGFTAGGPGGPMLQPVVGDWAVPPHSTTSGYDKSRETASPGYYSVFLNTPKVNVELTATMWTGLFRFTFPKSDKSHIVLDLDRVDGVVQVVNDHVIAGKTADNETRFNEAPRDPYFVAEFSRPFTSFSTFRHVTPDRNPSPTSNDVEANRSSISGRFPGATVTFATADGDHILVKIAHGQSYEEAQKRLAAEEPGWDFDAVRQRARDAWAKQFDKIEVTGGTEKERSLFYSCLEHSLVSPRLLAAKGEPYIGLDGKPYTADHDRYGPIPFWDTGRNQIVLLTLLEPDKMVNILQSTLDEAHEMGHMGTSFHGDNAVFLFLGNWERGTPFDYAAAYPALRKNATDPHGPRRYLAEYMKNGWISDDIPPGNPDPPYASGKAGVATTLEYAWDDYAMSQYAKKLGKTDDAGLFLARAHNYQNVFDPSVGFMRGRTADGKWISPFDPGEPYYNFMMKEASGWSTLWLVPHDVAGLFNLLGGREKAAAKLDAFFTTPYNPKGICRDCTGLIGQYVQGNQPDQQAAFLYDWAGQPWKTQDLTRRILHLMYGSDKYGYAFPGMDDQGSTSSWYVLAAMGFYPVDPSSPNYSLGSPLFNDMKLHLAGGKVFEVIAHNNSEKNIYIQSATMNGAPWTKPWFAQSDIANGATLVLEMGPSPNKTWGTAMADAPPSMSPMLP